MFDWIRSIRSRIFSAMALLAVLTALAPLTIATAPDGTLTLQPAAALADDDDDRDDWDDDDDDDDRSDDDDDDGDE